MLRKLFWLPALGALMMLLPTTTARAQEYLDAGSWLLTLSGTDTVANYQTALRSVSYNNISQNPSSAIARPWRRLPSTVKS